MSEFIWIFTLTLELHLKSLKEEPKFVVLMSEHQFNLQRVISAACDVWSHCCFGLFFLVLTRFFEDTSALNFCDCRLLRLSLQLLPSLRDPHSRRIWSLKWDTACWSLGGLSLENVASMCRALVRV